MGIQCNIILTYYTEMDWDEIRDKIQKYIGSFKKNRIEAEGNRNWHPTDLQYHVICMKDWEEEQ